MKPTIAPLPPVTDADLDEDFTGKPTKLSGRQTRVLEIALDHLDDMRGRLNSEGSYSAVKYATEQLLYGDRGMNDARVLIGATVDHLRQFGVLSPAERHELFGLSDVAA
jgi:hypothetical protein